MNFVDRILANGFVRYVSNSEIRKGRYDAEFNTSNGWMGLTIYHPYEKFENDDKKVELSLERYGVSEVKINVSTGEVEKTNINEKMIKITIGNEVIYENNYGVMPPKEIEQKLY